MKDKNNQNSSQYVNISLLDFNNISNISKVNTDVINSKKKQFSFGQSGRLSNIPNNRSKLSLFSINNHHHHNSIPTTEEIKKGNIKNKNGLAKSFLYKSNSKINIF